METGRCLTCSKKAASWSCWRTPGGRGLCLHAAEIRVNLLVLRVSEEYKTKHVYHVLDVSLARPRLVLDGEEAEAAPEGGGGWLDEDDKRSLNLSQDCLLAGKSPR